MDNRLREVRAQRGWLQIELAVIASVSPRTIALAERHGVVPGTPAVRERLAVALGVDSEWLFPKEPVPA